MIIITPYIKNLSDEGKIVGIRIKMCLTRVVQCYIIVFFISIQRIPSQGNLNQGRCIMYEYGEKSSIMNLKLFNMKSIQC